MRFSQGHEGLTRRSVLKGLGAAGIGAASGVAAHGFLYERHHLHVVRETLPVAGWPVSLDGLRVGFVTDLHRSAMVPQDMLTRAAELVMADAPDLIVLGGDYVTNRDRRFVRPAFEALAGLAAPHGVFAVLGNHDDERDTMAAIAASGFELLRDARTSIVVRGETVEFAGLRYWTHKFAEITRVLKGAAPHLILLAHTPKRVIEAAALSVPLVLSGHTHGGQIVLPGLGAIAAREFPVVAGAARRQDTTVFVSRGVGTIYVPIRVNCPPEVAVLTLRPSVPS
jgi:predicted MPP superfamily phosphohydrolase